MHPAIAHLIYGLIENLQNSNHPRIEEGTNFKDVQHSINQLRQHCQSQECHQCHGSNIIGEQNSEVLMGYIHEHITN